MKILLIEDEIKVAAFIKKGLQENDFEITIAENGSKGLNLITDYYFDLVILDINLPDINGFEVCKEIRKFNNKIPILMLTALSSLENKLEGFENGADDYLSKPFEFKELLARIKALLKRSLVVDLESNILKIEDLEINLKTKIVKRSNKIIELTAKEFHLLEFLVRNKNRVVSRVDIAEKIWDINFDTGTNVIDVYINFLRKKIDKDFNIKLIHTIIGMGYILKNN